jgi:hypothetical protein
MKKEGLEWDTRGIDGGRSGRTATPSYVIYLVRSAHRPPPPFPVIAKEFHTIILVYKVRNNLQYQV